jgi:hypothetical protein
MDKVRTNRMKTPDSWKLLEQVSATGIFISGKGGPFIDVQLWWIDDELFMDKVRTNLFNTPKS